MPRLLRFVEIADARNFTKLSGQNWNMKKGIEELAAKKDSGREYE